MSVFEVQYIDHIVLRVKAMERSIGVVEAGFYDRRGFVQGPSCRNPVFGGASNETICR